MLAIVDVWVDGRTSGAPARHTMAHLWTFDGDNIPRRCHFHLDIDEGRAAFEAVSARVV